MAIHRIENSTIEWMHSQDLAGGFVQSLHSCRRCMLVPTEINNDSHNFAYISGNSRISSNMTFPKNL